MPAFVDNLIAFRVLYKLVTPFKDTAAFKLGIIDEKGTVLRKANTLTKQEEKDAYTVLDRLVFNLKRIIAKLPGGESKLANIAAAYFLIRENVSEKDEEALQQLMEEVLATDALLVEETGAIVEFLSLFEEAPVNATGAAVSTNEPVVRKGKGGRRYAMFDVNDEVMTRFGKGKKKFSRWGAYLNLEDDSHRQIYDYAKKYPHGVIVLRNGDSIKALRYNRNGGGSWKHHRRTSMRISESYIVEDVLI